MLSRAWKCGFVAIGLIVLAGACGSSAKHGTVPTTRVTTPPATTRPGVQITGPRTVLSPIGINVRAEAKKTAPVLGTAAWGSVLTVLAHTAAGGGWFEVRGATHTGWISSDPRLSAPGEFVTYSSDVFAALYPPTWTHKPAGTTSVVFTSSTGSDSIIVATATKASQLAPGRAGYGQTDSRTIVVCGVTADLVTYSGASSSSTTERGATPPDPYLLQVRLILDAHHVLRFEANLSDLGPSLQVFSNFLDSVTFPFPQCIG